MLARAKPTLMQRLARDMKAKGKDVVLTAPTHKAVAVLARKIAEAKIEVPCRTIHSLLSLKPKPYGDRLVFERQRNAEPVKADLVVVDECSMVDAELFAHIRRHLPMAFVLFVGDPAQLPPVNEAERLTFGTKSKSHLDTIVRQGAGNPILDAAQAIRGSQGGDVDWTWCKSATAPPLGVYLPRGAADDWMKKAFTSGEFEKDPDTFRALAWTNRRVAELNEKIREWRYGKDLPSPFMVGERAMFRAPFIKDKQIVFNTNEEAKVLEIERSTFKHNFEECHDVARWTAEIQSWRLKLKGDSGAEAQVHMAADDRAFADVVNRVKDEAADARIRWKHLHDFQAEVAKLQSVYAMTVHCSQGSTFRNSFVDIADIRRRQDSNRLEMQQMTYVAATRPTHALMLLGV